MSKNIVYTILCGKAVMAYSLGPVLLIGPLFGLWAGHLSDAELSKNGIKTIGIVTEKWWSESAKKRENG